MSHIKDIQTDIELTSTLQGLVQTWEDVYVLQMQRMRNSVIQTRNFMQNIASTFNQLKSSYRQQLLSSSNPEQVAELLAKSKLKKSKQVISVLLSASKRLSGEINQQVFLSFLKYLEKTPQSDIAIVGRLGKQYYETSRTHQRPYRYFDLSEGALTVEQLKPLVSYLLDYGNVQIFFGKFESFLTQRPTKFTLTSSQIPEKTTPQEAYQFLYEPSAEDLLTFFEEQIFAALFKQTVHESYLAQIGSRLMLLETTATNIEQQLGKLAYDHKRETRRQANKKQLQFLVGAFFWGK